MSNRTPRASDAKTRWVRRALFACIFLIAVFAVILVANQKAGPPTERFVQIGSQKITLEVADANAERIQGLSNRSSLAKDSALLFVFPEPGEQCMWMKDMKFPIDMVWLDKDKKITKIEENVSPDTYPQAYCSDDTKYVLEFNTGIVKKNNLKIDQNLNF